MSQKVFDELSDIIQNRLHALANYQFVMYAHTLINGKSSKYEIQKSLARANSGEAKKYQNCPVFKVLVNKKLVVRTQENNEYFYKVAKIDQLTNNEVNDLIIIVKNAKRSYEQKWNTT